MKYLEKLENFINDLNEKIPFIGSHCCGSCATHAHEESGNQKSFYFLEDDLRNKASVGIDLVVKNMQEGDELTIMGLANKHNLSFYMSIFKDRNTFRMGVYSKRGKQEVKMYVDGKEIL